MNKRFVSTGIALLFLVLIASISIASDGASVEGATVTLSGAGATPAASEIIATRDISDQTVTPGETFTVTVVITANQDVIAPVLDEDLPSGWTVTEVDSAGAVFKSSTAEWLWLSSLSSGTSKTVTYSVTVPFDATAGSYTITGSVSAYVVDAISVSGESTVTVEAAAPTPTPTPTPTPVPAPALTPIGLIALVCLLALFATSMILRSKKR